MVKTTVFTVTESYDVVKSYAVHEFGNCSSVDICKMFLEELQRDDKILDFMMITGEENFPKGRIYGYQELKNFLVYHVMGLE